MEVVNKILKVEEEDILNYASSLRKICESFEDCKVCLACNKCVDTYDRIYDGVDERYGCHRANYLIRKLEEYEKETGNEELSSPLISLTVASKVEGIANAYKGRTPRRDVILESLNQLEKILIGDFEERDEEVEKLPVGQEIYSVVSISRRASQI